MRQRFVFENIKHHNNVFQNKNNPIIQVKPPFFDDHSKCSDAVVVTFVMKIGKKDIVKEVL